MNPEWSGERLETFVRNEATIEHLHRYALAQHLVEGKMVLDIACGEGYGSHLLAQSAHTVLGVDIDAAAIRQAAAKYKRPNLSFSEGTVTAIPAGDAAFDAVVSFETLEHLAEQEEMLREIKRVLRSGGLLVLSTPDKKFYTDEAGFRNPHHVKELYEAEFRTLLSQHFAHTRFLQQSFAAGSVIMDGTERQQFQICTGDFDRLSNEPPRPMYWIALASDAPLPGTPDSFFHSAAIYQSILEAEVAAVKSTFTYRLGHALLRPIKWLRRRMRS